MRTACLVILLCAVSVPAQAGILKPLRSLKAKLFRPKAQVQPRNVHLNNYPSAKISKMRGINIQAGIIGVGLTWAKVVERARYKEQTKLVIMPRINLGLGLGVSVQTRGQSDSRISGDYGKKRALPLMAAEGAYTLAPLGKGLRNSYGLLPRSIRRLDTSGTVRGVQVGVDVFGFGPNIKIPTSTKRNLPRE
jgi:hypothetical protein